MPSPSNVPPYLEHSDAHHQSEWFPWCASCVTSTGTTATRDEMRAEPEQWCGIESALMVIGEKIGVGGGDRRRVRDERWKRNSASAKVEGENREKGVKACQERTSSHKDTFTF